MNWLFIPYFEDFEGEVSCSICGRDLVSEGGGYIPEDLTDQQWEYLESRWDCSEGFQICEKCLGGHCGAFGTFTPDSWFERGPHTDNNPIENDQVWKVEDESAD